MLCCSWYLKDECYEKYPTFLSGGIIGYHYGWVLTVNTAYESRSGAEWDLEFSSLTNIIFVSPSLTKSLLTFWKEPGEENEMLDLSSLQWEYFSKRSQQSGTYLPRWWNLKLWYEIIQWKMVFGAHEFIVNKFEFFFFLPVYQSLE